MTMIEPTAGAASTYAPGAIALPSTSMKFGDRRGRVGVPAPRFAIVDSTLMVAAVQIVILAGLVPLPGSWKTPVLFVGLAFLLATLAVAGMRMHASRRLHSERRVVIRWLLANSSLTHTGAARLAWSECHEIGEKQYEFRSRVRGRLYSLIIDLDIKVASLTVE